MQRVKWVWGCMVVSDLLCCLASTVELARLISAKVQTTFRAARGQHHRIRGQPSIQRRVTDLQAPITSYDRYIYSVQSTEYKPGKR